MKIATYNVNGVNGRLPVLLRWLEEAEPDVVVLQELKAPQDRFPEGAIRDLGYDVIWHGQKSWNGVAMLSRVGEIHETRRGLPDDPDPSQSRYIEAAVNGILIGGLYLPNGNPRPGPKFDYKLRWFDRLIDHAAGLLESGLPVMLAGDFNVMPTDLDVYKPERWLDDALFAPEVRAAYFRLLDQGWTDALRTRHPGQVIYTFWDYFRNAYGRNAGLRIDHLLLSPALADRLVDAQVDAHVRGWEKTSDHAPVGKAMMAYDAEGVRTVWAEDFVVNSPNNTVLHREDVIAVMEQDFLDYKDFHKHITFVGEKPEITVVMGYDTMVPLKGPGAGKQVTRPFTDIWAKRSAGWQLIARQATIADAR